MPIASFLGLVFANTRRWFANQCYDCGCLQTLGDDLQTKVSFQINGNITTSLSCHLPGPPTSYVEMYQEHFSIPAWPTLHLGSALKCWTGKAGPTGGFSGSNLSQTLPGQGKSHPPRTPQMRWGMPSCHHHQRFWRILNHSIFFDDFNIIEHQYYYSTIVQIQHIITAYYYFLLLLLLFHY